MRKLNENMRPAPSPMSLFSWFRVGDLLPLVALLLLLLCTAVPSSHLAVEGLTLAKLENERQKRWRGEKVPSSSIFARLLGRA